MLRHTNPVARGRTCTSEGEMQFGYAVRAELCDALTHTARNRAERRRLDNERLHIPPIQLTLPALHSRPFVRMFGIASEHHGKVFT